MTPNPKLTLLGSLRVHLWGQFFFLSTSRTSFARLSIPKLIYLLTTQIYRVPSRSKYFRNIAILVDFLNILLEYRYTCYHILIYFLNINIFVTIFLIYFLNIDILAITFFLYSLNISILLIVFVMHLYKYQQTFIILFLHTSYELKIIIYLLLVIYFLHTCMNVSNLLTFILAYFSFRNILEYACSGPSKNFEPSRN